jgi:hypothetical protein
VTDDSSTGGFLQPAAAPAPLEGQQLLDYIQEWFVNICGLPGNMVRPRWQAEPPDITQAGNCWMAFGITNRPSDQYPYVYHIPGGNGSDNLQRHEQLEILTSFYDTGSTGLADQYAALLRDGTAIAQNREYLTNQGMNLVRAGNLLTVPSLLKLRWLYRVDLEIVIRRQIDRVYPVLNIESAEGDVYTDVGYPPQPFSN